MKASPQWEVEGRDWPNRAASRFVTAGGLSWHVQVMGQGPILLLIHGTGSATHTWRDVMPLLSPHFTVVAPDLPGHGFSGLASRRRLSLPAMAEAVAALLAALDIGPQAVVGHSAGAAVALRMALDGVVAPRAIVSLNGAFRPFSGIEGVVFPALAKLLFLNPLATAMITWRAADPIAVARVIAGTGSALDSRGIELYVRLLRTARHVEAALGMMASWDLRRFQQALPRLSIPLTLVAAEGDRAVPPQVAVETRSRLPSATLVAVPGLGHLAHEEQPAKIVEIILKACI